MFDPYKTAKKVRQAVEIIERKFPSEPELQQARSILIDVHYDLVVDDRPLSEAEKEYGHKLGERLELEASLASVTSVAPKRGCPQCGGRCPPGHQCFNTPA